MTSWPEVAVGTRQQIWPFGHIAILRRGPRAGKPAPPRSARAIAGPAPGETRR